MGKLAFLTFATAMVGWGEESPILSVSPSSGRGANQVFTVSLPPGKIPRSIAMVVNATFSTSRSCYSRYYPQRKMVALQNDAGDGWASSGEIGTTAVLGNNQCSIDLRRSSFSDAQGLTLKLAITFQPNFAGAKTVWAEAGDSGWRAAGTWSALAAINIRAPAWTPIMASSTAPEYFRYSGTEKTEIDSSANRVTLPHHFYEPSAPRNDPGLLSGVCSIPAGAPEVPPFWYDFSGSRLSGKPKSTIPSEYFVSPVRPNTGLQMRATFGGKVSGAGVLYETAYFHQQRCDAGGMEFGFYRDLLAEQTVFYVSSNSNCGIQPNGYCHVSDSYSSAYMNENNYPGQAVTTNINGWAIKNLNINGASAQLSNLYYSVFIVPDRSGPKGYRFQVEVFDPETSQHVNCDAHDTAGDLLFVDKPCGFPVRPGGWYQIDQLYKSSASGYVTVGIQRGGTPAVETAVDFAVDQMSIPKQ